MKKFKFNTVVPFLAVIAGVFIGSVLLILTGKNPIILFQELIKGLIGLDLSRGKIIQMNYIGELFVTSMPLILAGLAVGFAYKTGLFNIGAEGQVIMGSLFTILVATQLDLPRVIHLPLALFAGALGGALWGLIPGILKAYLNILEVVIGIMLNYVALYVSNFIVINLDGYRNLTSPKVPASATLRSEWLSNLFGKSRFHLGFIVVILAIIAFWFIIEKTTFGYNLRATGYNKDGAEYAGLKVNRNIVFSMMISGAFAGLAGSMLTLGTFNHVLTITTFGNVGYDGIAVALVGNLSAVGIGFAGVLFGLLSVTKPMLQMRGIPEEIGGIISALIVFFVASQKIFSIMIEHYNKRKGKDIIIDDEGGIRL